VTLRSSRADVLSHRFAAQELHRPATGVPGERLAVTALGVADVPAPAAATALAVRGGVPGDGVVLVWGARGAPALHRRSEVAWLAGALWPLDDADAAARISTARTRAAAALGLVAFSAVAHAVREVLASGTTVSKAELSQGVTQRVPDALSIDCVPCGARHVSGGLLQQAGLAGGAEVVRGGRAARYRLLADVEVPAAADGTADLVRRYLRLLGPARPADVARHLGASVTATRRVWPDDLVEVDVEGRRSRLPAEDADALGAAPAPALLRLLPAGDPWLTARDRDLVVPDTAHHRAVWPALGPPGVVLVRGEVAGTWRAARTGRRLDVTLTPPSPRCRRRCGAPPGRRPRSWPRRGARTTSRSPAVPEPPSCEWSRRRGGPGAGGSHDAQLQRGAGGVGVPAAHEAREALHEGEAAVGEAVLRGHRGAHAREVLGGEHGGVPLDTVAQRLAAGRARRQEHAAVAADPLDLAGVRTGVGDDAPTQRRDPDRRRDGAAVLAERRQQHVLRVGEQVLRARGVRHAPQATGLRSPAPPPAPAGRRGP